MAIYAGVGDDALAVFRREGALAIISTDGRMKVELSDVDASAGVALNDKLTVTGGDFTAEGTVVDLTRQGTSLTLTIQDDSLPMGRIRRRGDDGRRDAWHGHAGSQQADGGFFLRRHD